MQISLTSYAFMHDVLNHVARLMAKYILPKVINFSKKRAVAVRKFSPKENYVSLMHRNMKRGKQTRSSKDGRRDFQKLRERMKIGNAERAKMSFQRRK